LLVIIYNYTNDARTHKRQVQKQNVAEQVNLIARNFPLVYLSREQVFKCILSSDEIFQSNRLQIKEVTCYL